MLLSDSPVSGNCYKVRLLLAHLGLACERREVDVVDRSNRAELLGGLNPGLRVPVLVLDDGRALAESNHRALDTMESHLSQREFLVGDGYTIGDIALYAYTHVAGEGEFDLGLRPAIGQWLCRVAAQPGHVPISA